MQRPAGSEGVMDPNETLTKLREIKRRIQANVDTGTPLSPADAPDMADLFEALDDWLSKGGFLPADWQR